MKKLVLLLLLLIVLASCIATDNINMPLPDGMPSDFTHMNYFVIDGMPCMYMDTGYEEGGISCDWSKWDGRVEDGEIVLP